MRLNRLIPALAAACLLAVPGTANAVSVDPGQVLVTFRPAAAPTARAAVERRARTRFAADLGDGTQALRLARGQTVDGALAVLRLDPLVQSAVADYRAHTSDFIPNDPGFGGYAGWQKVQWNFDGPFGVGAPAAWDLARHMGAGGGRGAIVAVIDSGLAYENRGRYRRDPDLYPGAVVAPYDFLKNNHHPDDADGHGTHVTSTIAEKTNNKVGLTGLAYDVRVMPLRVLDANGNGDGSSIAVAIRYAVRHHANVINLSVEFDTSLRAADIPSVISAINYATSRGVVIVAAAGNEGANRISYPARDPKVISVGATTADGCLADYSNWGQGLTLVAPGGGQDAPLSDDPSDRANCRPDHPGREIFQVTFNHNPRHFGLYGFEGTSFATPHVSAAAALLIATGRLGPHPSPDAVRNRLAQTARDLGPPGYDPHYGAGLLDIAAALGP